MVTCPPQRFPFIRGNLKTSEGNFSNLVFVYIYMGNTFNGSAVECIDSMGETVECVHSMAQGMECGNNL